MAAAAASRDKISGETVRKAVYALLKWRTKLREESLERIAQLEEDEDEEEKSDDFIHLSLTLNKVPPRDLTSTPYSIQLRHSILPKDYSQLKFCLIVDGKKITSLAARNFLKAKGISLPIQVMKLAKLKSDFKSFDSKKKLHDSFDVFLAAKSVVPLLPMVLGRVFYKKRKNIPMPVDLKADGSNWKEEIEKACASSLLCLSSGTCSVLRVGRWGVNEGKEIVENVFEAIDGVLKIVPKKWSGIKCFHLRFSDSVALPVYEHLSKVQPDENKLGEVENGGSGLLVGIKRNRTELSGKGGQKKRSR